MRHVTGIGLAIVLAGAVFFAASWGYIRLLRIALSTVGISKLPSPGANLLHDTNVLYGVAALAGTALLAGIFAAAPRISPLAAGLPGLALLGWTIVYGFNVSRAVHYIPLRGDAFGYGFEAMGINGLLAAAGAALVVPLFIPSRWRSQARPLGIARMDDESAAPAQEPATSLLGNVSNVSVTSEWAETAPYPAGEPHRGNESYPD